MKVDLYFNRYSIHLIHYAIAFFLLLSVYVIKNDNHKKMYYYFIALLSIVIILYQGQMFYKTQNKASYHSLINLGHVLLGIFLLYTSYQNIVNFDPLNFSIMKRLVNIIIVMILAVHTYLLLEKY